MLIQRGELAKLSQFTFSKMSDITTAIHGAANALAELEIDPPKLTEATKATGGKSNTDPKRKRGAGASKEYEEEPDDGAPEEDEDVTGAKDADTKEESEVKDDSDDLPMLL